jgi:AbrB family looped-hinge helix DNA binding protein
LTEHKIGFVAQVTKGNKITIPHEIRKLLGIKTGDLMNISEIHKVEPREAI